jgi:predicted DNA-binding protein
MEWKTMSLRMPQSMAVDLAAVAKADGNPVSEAMREALEQYIVSRRSDQDFKKRLKERLEEDREILERLAE